MEAGRATGMIVGLIIGLVIAVVLIRMGNTNKKVKTEYDERQQAVRGDAYRYAFFTTCMSLAVAMIISLAEIELPFVDMGLYFMPIILGVLVLAGYTIWNDGYWGLNNNVKRYAVIFGVTGILNLLPVVALFTTGEGMENGKIGMPILNIMVLFMLIVLGGMLLAKKIAEKATGNSEEG